MRRYLGLKARCVGTNPPRLGLYARDDPAAKAVWDIVAAPLAERATA
jgi:hypothetical protein